MPRYPVSRREFFQQGVTAAALTWTIPWKYSLPPSRTPARNHQTAFVPSRPSSNERIQVACIGLGNRGRQHLAGFAAVPEAAVVAICDVDQKRLERRAEEFQLNTGRKVRCYRDFRSLLEDRRIDAVAIATCNHTHTPIALAALQAGKDVYIEKPCSHHIAEGCLLVRAARQSNCICFHGAQCRTSPALQEAVQWLEEGLLGQVRLARVRCPMAINLPAPVPDEPVPPRVAYDLWLGPAPARPFNRNRFHTHWRWWGEYGNGPLGNQVFHLLDIARWGLGVGWPRRVRPLKRLPERRESVSISNSSLHRLLLRNAPEWWRSFSDASAPLTWLFEFSEENKLLLLELHDSVDPPDRLLTLPQSPEAVVFYGTEGVMEVEYFGYRTWLSRRLLAGPHRQSPSQEFDQFIRSVHARRIDPHGPDIQQGHLSSGLIHLANIAAWLNQPIEFDPIAQTIVPPAGLSTF